MPRGKTTKTRRSKTFYIDTNVALDYITGRNWKTISVLEKIQSKKWECVSSSFLAMELADYKKDNIFIVEKALEEKWEMRRILREANQKCLREGDFEKVADWVNGFSSDLKNFHLYDFLQSSDDWQLAQQISLYSNLSAPDAIHLTSAILAIKAFGSIFLVTNDQGFAKEAQKIIEKEKLKRKLSVLTVSEVEKKFFPKR